MNTVVRRSLLATALGGAALALVATPALAHRSGEHGSGEHGSGDDWSSLLFRSDLVGSLTTDPVLFGVAPGGADWSPGRSRAEVRSDGRVTVRVRELVITSTGVNPVPQVSASLACNGAVVDTVGPVAFDAKGDARIEDRFDVPARCLAPAVLLNPLTRVGTYIAAPGTTVR